MGLNEIIATEGYWIRVNKGTLTDPELTVDQFGDIFASEKKFANALKDTSPDDFLMRMQNLPHFFVNVSIEKAIPIIAESRMSREFYSDQLVNCLLDCNAIRSNVNKDELFHAVKSLSITREQFEKSALYHKLLRDFIMERDELEFISSCLRSNF
jgi:hypothetical protein